MEEKYVVKINDKLIGCKQNLIGPFIQNLETQFGRGAKLPKTFYYYYDINHFHIILELEKHLATNVKS